MNEENQPSIANGNQAQPKHQIDDNPSWQIPSPQVPNGANPAEAYARQQLNQAYHQSPPPAQPAYNPYRPTESAYHVPPDSDEQIQTPATQSELPQTLNQHQVAPTAYVQQTDLLPNQQAVHGSVETEPRSVEEIKKQLLGTVRNNSRPTRTGRFKPILTALTVGIAFMFISYNEVAIAQIRQYISPGSSLSTPVILDPNTEVNISDEPRIIIPKINVDVPVVYDEKSYSEERIQAALERGVVHYGETALPGQIGNNVIVGHSSNNFFNSGKYKFAFVLLDRLETGDTFILHYKGTRYIYKVFNKEIITPDNFKLIQPTDTPVTTLITCTPPGTAWRRLVVQAEQISPSIEEAKQSDTKLPTDFDTPVPGASPSFWSRLTDIF